MSPVVKENKRNILALMLANCAGMVDLVALPLWVGTLIASYKFDPQQAGGLPTLFLIGDAVHATTPHLASGAGIGIEDALVLADELERQTSIEDALEAFQSRRWPRCRMVVSNSGRLGEIETRGGSRAEHASIMSESFRLLADEI